MNLSSTITESQILSDIIGHNRGRMSAEAAEAVLELKFTPRAITRINRLTERNRQVKITARERQELEKYLRVGNPINILQAQARLSLKSTKTSER